MLAFTPLALLVLFLGATGHDANAQSVQAPVRIAIVDKISSNDDLSSALVIRYSDAAQEDVLVIKKSSASPNVVAAALGLLQQMRSKPRPEKDRFVFVKGAVATQPLPAGQVRRLASLLRELDAAPTTTIGNLGTGRWIRLANGTLR